MWNQMTPNKLINDVSLDADSSLKVQFDGVMFGFTKGFLSRIDSFGFCRVQIVSPGWYWFHINNVVLFGQRN